MPAFGAPAAILLAQSAIAAAPLEEMARMTALLEASDRVGKAVFAFSEQGAPTFKEAFLGLLGEGCRDILILPLMVPLEPNYPHWIARSMQRWHIETGGDWPLVRIGRALSETEDLGLLLNPMLASALGASPTATNAKAATEGSVVSARKYRVLVCSGGPCTQAGAGMIWSHVRKLQLDMKLADRGVGMRSAKTSCLGPCALAPVVQVYPEGVFYGGVTEVGVERIVHEHLIEGRVIEDLAYHPAPGKQVLRPPRSGLLTDLDRA